MRLLRRAVVWGVVLAVGVAVPAQGVPGTSESASATGALDRQTRVVQAVEGTVSRAASGYRFEGTVTWAGVRGGRLAEGVYVCSGSVSGPGRVWPGVGIHPNYSLNPLSWVSVRTGPPVSLEGKLGCSASQRTASAPGSLDISFSGSSQGAVVYVEGSVNKRPRDCLGAMRADPALVGPLPDAPYPLSLGCVVT